MALQKKKKFIGLYVSIANIKVSARLTSIGEALLVPMIIRMPGTDITKSHSFP